MNNKKGITMVALVVTVVVLIIITGVTVSTFTGTNVFEKGKETMYQFENREDEEMGETDKMVEYASKHQPIAKEVENDLKIGQKVNYVCPVLNFNQEGGTKDIEWLILDTGTKNQDGTYSNVKIISKSIVAKIQFDTQKMRDIRYYQDGSPTEWLYTGTGVYEQFYLGCKENFNKIIFKQANGVRDEEALDKGIGLLRLKSDTNANVRGDVFLVPDLAESVRGVLAEDFNPHDKSKYTEEELKKLKELKYKNTDGSEDYLFPSEYIVYKIITSREGTKNEEVTNKANSGLRVVVTLRPNLDIKQIIPN